MPIALGRNHVVLRDAEGDAAKLRLGTASVVDAPSAPTVLASRAFTTTIIPRVIAVCQLEDGGSPLTGVELDDGGTTQLTRISSLPLAHRRAVLPLRIFTVRGTAAMSGVTIKAVNAVGESPASVAFTATTATSQGVSVELDPASGITLVTVVEEPS